MTKFARPLTFAAAAAAVMLAGSAATAQQVTVAGGAVAGEITSASLSLSANQTATVLTTPGSGKFVVTTFCSTSDQTILQGLDFGFIAEIPESPADSCITFAPGVAVPQDEELQCRNVDNFAVSCQVSGVRSVR